MFNNFTFISSTNRYKALDTLNQEKLYYNLRSIDSPLQFILL